MFCSIFDFFCSMSFFSLLYFDVDRCFKIKSAFYVERLLSHPAISLLSYQVLFVLALIRIEASKR